MVVVLQLLTVFRFGMVNGVLDLTFAAFYIVKLLSQLCDGLSLPLTETIIRVYVDGIF